MNRRTMGAAASVLLALLGTGVLIAYVRSAEERAVAGKELVQVILIDGDRVVRAGTEADRIPLRVAQVPAETVVANVVEDAIDLIDMVASVDLIPGEQLIWDRLTDAEEYAEEQAAIQGPTDLPPGYLEVTIPVAPDRALGGRLDVGETVALVGIFEGVRDPEVDDPNEDILLEATSEDTLAFVDQTQLYPTQSTRILAERVLITGIQAEQLPIEIEAPEIGGDEVEDDDPADDEPQITQAPTGNYLISFALRAYDVERVVFAQEFGSLWLARDPEGTDHSGTQVQDTDSIYARIDEPLPLTLEVSDQ